MAEEAKYGVVLSIGLHGALAAMVYFGGDLFRRPVPDTPIPVELAFSQEIEDQAAQEEEPEAQPAPEQPDPTPPVAQEEPQAPQPEPLPEDSLPPDDPAPTDQREEPEPETETAPPRLASRTIPRSKPTPPTPDLDLDQLAALIDKSVDEQPVIDPLADVAEDLEAAARKQQARDLQTRRDQVAIQTYLRAKVQRCWSIPAGAKDAQDLTVILRISLRPDGTLMRPPSIVGGGGLTAPGNEFHRAFAESAKRAIQRCEPYRIPVEDYNQWKEIEFVFDPRAALGG